MLELNKIYNMDCLEGMKNLPDKCVDLVFYDPPYNIGKNYDTYDDNLLPADYEMWMKSVAKEAKRISKRGIVVYVSGKLTPLFFKLLPDAHLIVVWKRAAGVFSGNYMLQYHSMFSTAKPLIKCKDLWDDVRLPGEGYFFKEKRFDNPGLTGQGFTEKVIRYFSNEGDIILDPFMGTGTTAASAKTLNRNYIGYEISKWYWNVSNNRLLGVM
jgi:site-specific DNA-methyltransferase (adenine-specific)